jgi:hypothetical protein
MVEKMNMEIKKEYVKKSILPNFLVCGAMRSGTTSLYYYLKQHPDIFMSPLKEIHFFTNDLNYHKGLNWYKQFFIDYNGEKMIGEITPNYMIIPEAPKRIFSFSKNIRLIFILRNPTLRAYSHYWHSVRRGEEKFSFEKALELEEERLKENTLRALTLYSYKNRGIYVKHIENYLNYFPKSQMLFLLMEELRSDPEYVLNKLFSFLDVDPSFKPLPIEKENYGGAPKLPFVYSFFEKLYSSIRKKHYPITNIVRKNVLFFKRLSLNAVPQINPKTKNQLDNFFNPYNESLSKLLDMDLTIWTKK